MVFNDCGPGCVFVFDYVFVGFVKISGIVVYYFYVGLLVCVVFVE